MDSDFPCKICVDCHFVSIEFQDKKSKLISPSLLDLNLIEMGLHIPIMSFVAFFAVEN